jgi:hypothetical protein
MEGDYVIRGYIPVGLIRSKNVPAANLRRSSAEAINSASSQLFPISSRVCTHLSQSPRAQSCPLRPPCLSGYNKKFSSLSSSARDALVLPRYLTHSRGVHSANPIFAQLGACPDTCPFGGPCQGTSGPPTRSTTPNSNCAKCSTTSRWRTSNGWLGLIGSSSTSIASAAVAGSAVRSGSVRTVRLWNFDVCPSNSLKVTVGAPANSAVAIARLVQPFVGLSVQIPIVPQSMSHSRR